jgi:hypothetical protein
VRRTSAEKTASPRGAFARIAPGRNDVGVSTHRAGALLAVAAALALAACGGGGATTSSTSSGPSHAQYVAAANAICATAARQTAPLIAKVKSSGAAAVLSGGGPALAAIVSRLHDVAAVDLARLRALAQPPADHGAIARVLEPLTTVVADIGRAATALAKGEALNALALIQQAQPVAARVTGAARALGAARCGAVLAALS